MTNHVPDDPRSDEDEQPCANDPSGLVRTIVRDNVVTILDYRPTKPPAGPLPPHMLEQLRRFRRRREEGTAEPPPSNS